jgi:2'-5' RNA ligase
VRLFVAVWPPPHVIALVEALDRPDSDHVRWTRPDQWHVTLRFLGQVEDPDEVTARLTAARLGPATARLGPAAQPLGPGVLCLPVAGLDRLAESAIAATSDVGRPPEARPFHGHLTLARATRGAPRGALRKLPRLEADASWPVDVVTVVASTLGHNGASYEVVGSVGLGGGPSGP